MGPRARTPRAPRRVPSPRALASAPVSRLARADAREAGKGLQGHHLGQGCPGDGDRRQARSSNAAALRAGAAASRDRWQGPGGGGTRSRAPARVERALGRARAWWAGGTGGCGLLARARSLEPARAPEEPRAAEIAAAGAAKSNSPDSRGEAALGLGGATHARGRPFETERGLRLEKSPRAAPLAAADGAPRRKVQLSVSSSASSGCVLASSRMSCSARAGLWTLALVLVQRPPAEPAPPGPRSARRACAEIEVACSE